MTAEAAKSAGFERDDIELVKMFLSQYKDEDGNSYALESRPDTTERKEKAIEAIAVAKNGRRLAIEHTLIQPFEVQKADDVPFLNVFGQLETDETLRVPNRLIEVSVPPFAIPKNTDWNDVAEKVGKWFAASRNTFTVDKADWHTVPSVGFELKVRVETIEISDPVGIVSVDRHLPKGEPLEKVVRRALNNKVPKLVWTRADEHILLFETDTTAFGFAQFSEAIDDNLEDLSDLTRIDSVWVARTVAWKSSGDVLFIPVRPADAKKRFWVKDHRFIGKRSSGRSEKN